MFLSIFRVFKLLLDEVIKSVDVNKLTIIPIKLIMAKPSQ